jgi:hypothetical protein
MQQQDSELDFTSNHNELTLLASEPLDASQLDYLFGYSLEYSLIPTSAPGHSPNGIQQVLTVQQDVLSEEVS